MSSDQEALAKRISDLDRDIAYDEAQLEAKKSLRFLLSQRLARLMAVPAPAPQPILATPPTAALQQRPVKAVALVARDTASVTADVAPAQKNEEMPRFEGERVFPVWDEHVCRATGKSLTWEKAVEAARRGLIRKKER